MHRRLLIAAAAVFASTAAASADGGGLKGDFGTTYSHMFYSGGEFAKNAWEGYYGSIWALNRDLSKEGVMFRTHGAYGRYDYRDVCPGPGCPPSLIASEHDGKYWQGDVMVGYQWVRDRLEVGLYVGADWQKHRIKPIDTFNPVSGSETGFKVAGDIETKTWALNLPHYFLLEGSYSTAFDTYYVLGRAGLNRGGVIFGVEGWLLGDETGDAQRLGGFVAFQRQLRPDVLAELSLSAGYQFVDEDGKLCSSFFGSEGGYGTLNLTFKFGDRDRHHALK